MPDHPVTFVACSFLSLQTAACRVGDGDCGATLKQGADAVAGALSSRLPLNDPTATLRALASTVGQAMGGTSGAIYRILFTAAAGLLPCSILDLFMPAGTGMNHRVERRDTKGMYVLSKLLQPVTGQTVDSELEWPARAAQRHQTTHSSCRCDRT